MTNNYLLNNLAVKKFIVANNWSSAVKFLLEDQKKNWSQLSRNYESLNSVEVKEFEFDSFKLRVQFNPGRITSTSADVDNKTIRNRACFLCIENLPVEQKGLLYKNNFVILANPYPIFPAHFTIVKTEHTPQEILISFKYLLSLSKDLSNDFTVFYNGPQCGASAPDHLHFQAGNSFFLPLESDYKILMQRYGDVILSDNNTSVSAVDDGLRRFITFESDKEEEATSLFKTLYHLYKKSSEAKDEPKLNILSSYEQGKGWRIIFFLREKHRPSHYFAAGEDRILLSPAAVDYGGVCITPIKKDFDMITKNILIEIFNEVSYDKDKFKYLVKILKQKCKVQ